MSRRVVVTGLGGVCATGANVAEFWANAKKAHCGISRRTLTAEEFSLTLPIAPIDGFEARSRICSWTGANRCDTARGR